MAKSHLVVFFCISLILLHMSPKFTTSAPAQDNVRYISDSLVIKIKNNIESPYEVVASVQSDDSVQIIEQKGNYCKISTADGKQGWISKHYLKSEPPKTLVIKQLQEELADLKSQLTLKQSATPAAATIGEPSNNQACQEIQLKLNDAEKSIARLQEELKAQQNSLPDPSAKTSELVINATSLSIEQLEQNPENFTLLISEYEKRGKQISELQNIISKRNDQTRFLWFAAGALVFLVGLLTGRTSNRKKGKLLY